MTESPMKTASTFGTGVHKLCAGASIRLTEIPIVPEFFLGCSGTHSLLDNRSEQKILKIGEHDPWSSLQA